MYLPHVSDVIYPSIKKRKEKLGSIFELKNIHTQNV